MSADILVGASFCVWLRHFAQNYTPTKMQLHLALGVFEIRLFIVAIIVSQLGACSAWNDWRFERHLQEAREDARKGIDYEACIAAGGRVEGIGMFGIPSCVEYYTDGGKYCTDNSQCQGLCFTPVTYKIGTSIHGVCQSSEHDSFGCISTVQEGVVDDTFCQD